MESLQDKTAVVIGGGSGIGRAAALSLARRGARLVVADINTEAAQATARHIAADGGTAVGLYADVAAEGTFEDLKAAALERFGRVDVVMNNAGVLTRGLPEHVPVAEWQRVFDINLMSVVRSNAVFLPLLISQGHGHIVNTSSFAGLFTYSYDRMPYGAAKAALVQMSEGLRLYLHPQGIGVTLLCPGPVSTNIRASLRTFGPETVTRGLGPQFPSLDPAVVGEQVADAILAGTFIVYTHPQVRDLLIERATDWNAFIAQQTQTIADS